MKIVKQNEHKKGDDMSRGPFNLDKLKNDLEDLCIDLLSPPEKVTVELIEERLDIHKKLRSIIDGHLNFDFKN